MASRTFRVAIIGDTPRGRYGQWLDQAFVGVEGAEIVALSDPDEAGRQAAIQRNGDELFLDFHPHMFDLMWLLFGAPLWCHARITQDGRSVTPEDVHQGGGALRAGRRQRTQRILRIRGRGRGQFRVL